jgi:hypothetical protein
MGGGRWGARSWELGSWGAGERTECGLLREGEEMEGAGCKVQVAGGGDLRVVAARRVAGDDAVGEVNAR